jgi:hypothetical protein
MDVVFRVTGVLLACYVVKALVSGAVYAKSGPWGRTCRRDEDALGYWSAVVVYALVSLALVFVF